MLRFLKSISDGSLRAHSFRRRSDAIEARHAWRPPDALDPGEKALRFRTRLQGIGPSSLGFVAGNAELPQRALAHHFLPKVTPSIEEPSI